MLRDRSRQCRFGFALVSLLIFGNPTSYAQGSADYAVGISEKFGRGLVNVLSAPLEIPCAMGDEVKERGGTGLVTGLFRGLALTARRILVGSTEVMTFMIPMEATIPVVCAKKAPPKVEV